MGEHSSNNNMSNLLVILFVIVFIVVVIVLFNTYGVKEYIKEEYDKLPPDMQERIDPFVPISEWKSVTQSIHPTLSTTHQML